MRRHVVRSLGVVLEARVAVSNKVRDKSLDVTQDARISVLANDQARARVPAEHVAESGIDLSFRHD